MFCAVCRVGFSLPLYPATRLYQQAGLTVQVDPVELIKHAVESTRPIGICATRFKRTQHNCWIHPAKAQSRRDPVVNAPAAIVGGVFTFMRALRKLDSHHDIRVLVVTAKDHGT